MTKIEIDSAIKGLIFDCDGTLVDSMPLHLEAWKHALVSFGAEYDQGFFDALRGMKETEIVHLYNSRYGTRLDPTAIVATKYTQFKKHMADLQPIRPVADVVEAYFGKLPLAVVSGSMRHIVRKELEIIELVDRFDCIITAEDPFRPKPAPDKFIEAARRLGVDPATCLVFEDGDLGLQAARAAGMASIDVRTLANE